MGKRLLQMEKGLLFACCVALHLLRQPEGGGILTVLAAIIVSGLLSLVEHPLPQTGLTVGYALLCGIFPDQTFFLPLLAYDIPKQRYWAGSTVCLIPLWLMAASQPPHTSVPVLLLVPVSLLLRIRAIERETLTRKHLSLIDANREAQQRLSRRNRELMDRQDTELRAATLDERNRIAREIHDSVGHLLASALLQTGALMVSLRNGEETEGLRTLKDTLAEAMDSIRRSVHDLREDAVDLQAQLQALTEGFTFCRLRLDNGWTEDPGMKVKSAVLAVCREALANLMKHSDATEAELVLRDHPGFRQLIISDNGNVKAFLPDAGMGLANMEERIRLLGGQFRISTDRGFRIFITLPKEDTHAHRGG